jgi:hypothetical protein
MTAANCDPERDDYHVLDFWWSMICSENRHLLFRIML